ncbi:MAG: phosphoribosylanthranilate isomerase [Sarcina sp.]
MRVRYKICGIQSIEEIENINKTTCEYIGFVFSKSKRRVDLDKYNKISKFVRRDILKVGVFKDEGVEFIKNIIENSNIDIIQLHGEESLDYINKLSGNVIWKSVVGDENLKLKISLYKDKVERILIDASSYGEGKVFDWDLLRGLEEGEFIIAGGLSSENINSLLEVNKPYAVDLSSSVEVDGKKNKELIDVFNKCMIGVNEDFE